MCVRMVGPHDFISICVSFDSRVTFRFDFASHSGIFGERLPLRYYLSFGMLMSGLFTCLFGLGFYLNIHSLAYYASIQVTRQVNTTHTSVNPSDFNPTSQLKFYLGISLLCESFLDGHRMTDWSMCGTFLVDPNEIWLKHTKRQMSCDQMNVGWLITWADNCSAAFLSYWIAANGFCFPSAFCCQTPVTAPQLQLQWQNMSFSCSSERFLYCTIFLCCSSVSWRTKAYSRLAYLRTLYLHFYTFTVHFSTSCHSTLFTAGLLKSKLVHAVCIPLSHAQISSKSCKLHLSGC